MKKFFTILLMLFATISIAVAQPAMMTKRQVSDSTQVDDSTLYQDNRLSVEIISEGGRHFDHPQHPANGIECPFSLRFTTAQGYSSYYWETSLPSSETWYNNILRVNVYYQGYIKVTVWDNYGHTGSDSIWFNVRNANVPPMENFIMEIDDDNLSPTLHGITIDVHHKLLLMRGYVPGQWVHYEYFFLSPGEWSFRDTTVNYSDDSLWIYSISLFDLCESCFEFLVPGVLLGTEEHRLIIKSILQDEIAPMIYTRYNFRYCIYTVDEYGNRHHYTDLNGNHVILQPQTTSWDIPGPHIDPYYQVGVGRQLEDGSYQLLSLSNKVPNPWPDIDGIDEQENKKSFSIFPNPSNGRVSIIGTGTISVFNILGQEILAQEIHCQAEITLPKGIYIARLLSPEGESTTKKIIIQ